MRLPPASDVVRRVHSDHVRHLWGEVVHADAISLEHIRQCYSPQAAKGLVFIMAVVQNIDDLTGLIDRILRAI